jgi:serine/threonine protein kinase/Tfp pilus assembly protein PilF
MLEKLYHEALELPSSERRPFLERAAGGDQALVREVEALLAVEDDTRDIVNSNAIARLSRNQGWRPKPGTMMGPYRLESLLGEGGMALVYRARDTRLDREVAVKVVRASPESEGVSQQRLLREARTAASLHHPNICTIFDVGESDGRVFIAMELVIGRPLKEIIPEDGLSVELAVEYAVQIADALGHAHQRMVIHRDLKSSNVMVTEEGTIKVFDFGIARRIQGDPGAGRQTLTEAGLITGTPAYMAPELLCGEAPTKQTDLWAAGVLFYEMLTGRMPFAGPTTVALAAAILHDSAAPVGTKVSPPLAAIIRRCLEKDPSRRFISAAEVKAGLKGLAPRPVRASRRTWIKAGAVAPGAAAIGTWVARDRLLRGSRLSSGGRPSPLPEANAFADQAWAKISTHADLVGARKLLERALLLDPRFAEARATLGLAYFAELDSGQSNDSGLLPSAAAESRRAIEIDSRCARAWSTLSAVLLYQGHKRQAFESARRALAIDSRHTDALTWLGNCHMMDGKYDQTLAAFRGALQMEPNYLPAQIGAAEILRRQGKEDAGREFNTLWSRYPGNPRVLRGLVQTKPSVNQMSVFASLFLEADYKWKTSFQIRLTIELNDTARARAAGRQVSRELDKELEKYASLVAGGPLVVAEIYAISGDVDRALDWLDRAVRSGDEEADWFRRNPHLASIQNHLRFRQIVESIESAQRSRGR